MQQNFDPAQLRQMLQQLLAEATAANRNLATLERKIERIESTLNDVQYQLRNMR